jgi:hypothetical protein
MLTARPRYGSPVMEAHVVVTAGLPAEPLPLPPGHSEEQREAEGVMLELLSARLGVNLEPRLIRLPSGVRLEVDGACDDPPILCEAWAHQGAAKSAQRDKVAKDILKLPILKEAAREAGAPTPRLILLFGDAAAARACGGRSWKAEAVRRFSIEVEVVELPDETRLAVMQAQVRQFR